MLARSRARLSTRWGRLPTPEPNGVAGFQFFDDGKQNQLLLLHVSVQLIPKYVKILANLIKYRFRKIVPRTARKTSTS
jgi:hypothetical protein